jgi:formate hydrogenlyase subunit 3/multisubunit Na+/H+ antiporter MnhD subunit
MFKLRRKVLSITASFIYFELYESLFSYVGFGHAPYEPRHATRQSKTYLPMSVNITISAFRSLVIQIALEEVRSEIYDPYAAAWPQDRVNLMIRAEIVYVPYTAR